MIFPAAYDGNGRIRQVNLNPAIRVLTNVVTDIAELEDSLAKTRRYYPEVIGVIKGQNVVVALLPERKYAAKIFSKEGTKNLRGTWQPLD